MRILFFIPSQRVCLGLERAMGLKAYREVGGRSPGGLAVDIADKGFVDVAGAHEAVVRAVRDWLVGLIDAVVPLINVCCDSC
jgi:hypothetical protein